LDGETLNAVNDAIEAAEDGNLADAEEEIDSALENVEEKQRELE